MKTSNFLLYRLHVHFNMRGIEYVFSRQALDKFGQPLDDTQEEIKLKGIYHESNGYIQTAGYDAAIIRTEKSPMILCLFDDGNKIKQGDMITIAEKTFRVSGVLNIQNYSIVADISLEEVD